MTKAPCPFCRPDASRVFHDGERILGLWDAFPVNPGHALLVPKRHVADWFEASPEEQSELLQGVGLARATILERHDPQGFNIGINIGIAAGQTVSHLHVHVIPRYSGDVDDPRGGVRHVIPARGNYLDPVPGGTGLVSDRVSGYDQAWVDLGLTDLPHARSLIGGGKDPLLPHILTHLDRASQVDMAVAFVLGAGVALLEPHLRELAGRGGRLRLLTGDYFDVSDPDALMRLIDLRQEFPERVELRVFECRDSGFHPKAYLFYRETGPGVALVGSSNLSRSALTAGSIEWSYASLPSRDERSFNEIADGFEALFGHDATRNLDAGWVAAYRQRRQAHPRPLLAAVEVPSDPPEPPPEPHEVQREALAALEATRAAGNSAGLVVMATGLGKTWLAAFDTHRRSFERVLFVAHREEILGQAMRTFRRIRPDARLGMYTGQEKAPNADVLFASVQTLSRLRHLEQFAPDAFDYMIVDEFHHATARTYRRLIDYIEPQFLLGLTATPERTDGGDLLALCQENLVYRCDLADGIRRGLLSPFHYFGVPDEVDYANVPWRGSRFDKGALTQAVATQARAQNALEQHRTRAGSRTLAFCCSTQHADFMREFFRQAGVRSAAVHSAPGSNPRSTSLERLRDGDLDVVFAVDMFNEGVDLPNIDTILMLRPTESRILWLQQLGRGLRKSEGKDRLTVIDYIGNHRVFLLKPQTLLELGAGDAVIRDALDRVAAGKLDLPPGCEVTYELEAIEILRSLLPSIPPGDALRAYYEEFRERTGERPRAVQASHDGYNPRAARRGYGSWLGLVRALGDGDPTADSLLDDQRCAGFLQALETTQMARSYKMLVLLAMLNLDRLPGQVDIDTLAEEVRRLAARSAVLTADLGRGLESDRLLRRLLEKNPIAAWVGGKGTGGTAYFEYADSVFRTRFDAAPPARETLQELTRELVEWRLAEYLARPFTGGEAGGPFTCKVSHSDRRPIIFLPSRDRHPGLPTGSTPILIDGEECEADFVKIALNVVRRPGSPDNALPDILRGWFGADAGLPGTSHRAILEQLEDGWHLKPALPEHDSPGPDLWRSYQRSEIPGEFGLPFSRSRWNQGFVFQGEHIFLLVTLEKKGKPGEYQYKDRFLARDVFEWQSQNRHSQESPAGQAIRHHAERGIAVHLFVRRQGKIQGRGAPFVYCGDVTFGDWEGERPISVRWRLPEPLPDRLWPLFQTTI